MTRRHHFGRTIALLTMTVTFGLSAVACGGSDGTVQPAETTSGAPADTDAAGSVDTMDGSGVSTSSTDGGIAGDSTIPTDSTDVSTTAATGATSTTTASTQPTVSGPTTTAARATTTTASTTPTSKPPTTTTKPVVTTPPTTAKPTPKTRTFSATYGAGTPTFKVNKGDYVILTINSAEDQEFHIHDPYDIVNGGTHVTFEFTADQVGNKIIVESHTHPGEIVCYLTVG